MAASRFDQVVSVVLTAATLCVLALLFERRLEAKEEKVPKVEYIKDWQDRLKRAGRALDRAGSPVVVAVFTDFECPYCRRMDSTLTELSARFPGKITRQIVHLPIAQHKNARPAALAFECAFADGHAMQMHRELYRVQDSLGTLPWVQVALRAGTRDTSGFSTCLGSASTADAVVAGERQAEDLRVGATPTVLVNGWKFDPSLPEQIERAVEAAVQGRSPNAVR